MYKNIVSLLALVVFGLPAFVFFILLLIIYNSWVGGFEIEDKIPWLLLTGLSTIFGLIYLLISHFRSKLLKNKLTS